MASVRLIALLFWTLAAWVVGAAMIYAIYGLLLRPDEIGSVIAWLKSGIPIEQSLPFVLTRPAVLLSALLMAGLIVCYQLLVAFSAAILEDRQRSN